MRTRVTEDRIVSGAAVYSGAVWGTMFAAHASVPEDLEISGKDTRPATEGNTEGGTCDLGFSLGDTNESCTCHTPVILRLEAETAAETRVGIQTRPGCVSAVGRRCYHSSDLLVSNADSTTIQFCCVQRLMAVLRFAILFGVCALIAELVMKTAAYHRNW